MLQVLTRIQLIGSQNLLLLFQFWCATSTQQLMPGVNSKWAPLLPIPNRTVKRLCADDSAGSRVKVGHRQANI